MIKLNKDQEEAAEKIIDFVEGKYDVPFFTLAGAAGTGKSVMLKEALSRTNIHIFDRSAAAVSHAAKNVICDSFHKSIPCFTVAQWLGLRMSYGTNGEILFTSNRKAPVRLKEYKIAVLDEASMVSDYLYNEIMNIVNIHKIKLISVGDKFQLSAVKQNHDSKFFDKIDAELTIPVRFTGPIMELSTIYRNEIRDINDGYSGNPFALNEATNREDKFDKELGTGYYFKNNIYEIIDQVADEISSNPIDMNFSRVLAFKNSTVQLLNREIRKRIYGKDAFQFEVGEVVISNGGFSRDKVPIITNGELLKIDKIGREEIGPYNIPIIVLYLKGTGIPVVQHTEYAINLYNNIKTKLAEYAKRDPSQWVAYYKFINSFAYFDYTMAINAYKSQGQTIDNVYVMEGEMMGIKPLNLKQKYQSLYVAVTRARKNVYIYNKNY